MGMHSSLPSGDVQALIAAGSISDHHGCACAHSGEILHRAVLIILVDVRGPILHQVGHFVSSLDGGDGSSGDPIPGRVAVLPDPFAGKLLVEERDRLAEILVADALIALGVFVTLIVLVPGDERLCLGRSRFCGWFCSRFRCWFCSGASVSAAAGASVGAAAAGASVGAAAGGAAGAAQAVSTTANITMRETRVAIRFIVRILLESGTVVFRRKQARLATPAWLWLIQRSPRTKESIRTGSGVVAEILGSGTLFLDATTAK
jgi:hypothetical protein